MLPSFNPIKSTPVLTHYTHVETETRRDLVTHFRYTISKWRSRDLNPNPFYTNVCSLGPSLSAAQRENKEGAVAIDYHRAAGVRCSSPWLGCGIFCHGSAAQTSGTSHYQAEEVCTESRVPSEPAGVRSINEWMHQ